MESAKRVGVFIGNLAPDATAEQVGSLVQEVVGSPARSVNLQPDPHGGRPHRGYGYAVFDSDAIAARAVVALNGRLFNGRPLRSNLAPAGVGTTTAQRTPLLAGSVRTAVDGLSTAELWAIASEIKALSERNYDQARQLLGQYPMLTHAMLRIEERLGMLQAMPAAMHEQARQLAAAQAQQAAAQAQQQKEAAAAAAAAAAAQQQQQTAAAQPVAYSVSSSSESSFSSSSPTLPTVAPIDDPEQVELLRGILGMTDDEVTALEGEQREGVMQVRNAVGMGMEAIAALQPGERDELLTLRAQLIATLGVTPVP